MKDIYGYEELVVHSPGLNFMTVFLFFSMFKPTTMAKTAPIFAKTMFWIENILFYFTYMLIYHLILLLIVYFKLGINVARASSFALKAPFTLLWIVLGPFYLLGVLVKDLYCYSTILCDYKEEVDVTKVTMDEDKLQDKIFIYNEIIDTLRSVMNIFQYNYKALILDKVDEAEEQEPQ